MTCITGFLAAVPTANRDAFLTHATTCADGFMEYGVTSLGECWGDDVADGDGVSMPRAVLAKEDETVVFSWYRWPSLEVQKQAMETAMTDPRLSPESNPMPFDGKRVIWGNFAPILELGAPQEGGYVDGYIAPVPASARAEFEAFARYCDAIFMEHGARWCVECWELEVPDGTLTDFRRAVAATPEEAILFSWVQWESRAARDRGNEAISNDPRFASIECPMDMSRMIHGGFEPLLRR